MDGLLINSEDKLTQGMNQLLEKYGRPPLTGHVRAKLMGVPNSSNGDVFHDWAKLPISREQWAHESAQQMRLNFPDCKALPGAEELLSNLSRAQVVSSGDPIAIALASSTKTDMYEVKTSRPDTKRLLDYIPPDRRVLGDDPRLPRGRGKPAPDIYLLALQQINSVINPEHHIMPDECLVFEDSAVGVEAGRRAGMRVVWVPHPDMAVEYEPLKEEVLAGRTGLVKIGDEWQLGEMDDGWAEMLPSLEDLDYERYGIHVPL